MIELVDVSKTYKGGVQALGPTDLSIETGRVTVLLGPSGAGKSTLLRCMNLLVKPSTGGVRADGVPSLETRGDLRRHRRRTGMVFQHHQLTPRYTALRNVLLGRVGYYSFWRSLLPFGRADERIALEALDRVGLLDKALTRVDNLSGGMQQRVGLARALANDPEILLMDEAFSALDPLIRRDMQDELLELQERMKKTIVFITHDLDEALRIGDRIALMKDGALVQIGTPEEMLTNPADRYVERFIEDVDLSKVLTAARVMRRPETIYPDRGPRVALELMRE
ncbi:MAG: ATP-binding cassette domain-containing protein, partial [Dermabacter sp.]|nr:ATP-binding cassette domain-containing protein [Dermabacter sp.]